ncbi:MAG: M48 family metalloprotease [Acidimicrobiales bacterium]
MTPLPSVPGQRVVRALEKVGFKVARTAGSHHVMRHPDGCGTTVPVHAHVILNTAGSLGAEGAAAWLAYAWAARSLSCNFASARALFGPGAACPVPVALAGQDAFVPAAVSGAVVVASAIVFLASLAGMAVASCRAGRYCARRRVYYPLPPVARSMGFPEVPRWLVVLPEGTPAAYCTGLLWPRVVVSSGLLGRLGEPALRAVLAHELSHRRRRDPLRYALAKSLARGLFFVPSLGDLADATLADNEASADARAVGSAGRGAVVDALLEMMAAHPPVPAGSAAMAGGDILRVRVEALESGKHPRPHLRPARMATSLLALAALLGAGAWLAAPPRRRAPAAPRPPRDHGRSPTV